MKLTEAKLKKYHTQQIGDFACGLACLSTIAKFHGGEVSQESLREISGTTSTGTTLLGLIHAGKEIGLEAKGFEAEIKHLKEQENPVILHVILDRVREHYVVCFGHDGKKFLISDPAKGIQSLDENQLREIWQSGILLVLKPAETFTTNKNQRNSKFKWFRGLISEDIPILIVAAIIGALMAITGLSTAIFSQKLIDDFLPNQTYNKAIWGVIALGVLLLFRALLGYFQGVFMARQGRDLNVRIVSSFIDKILRLPIKYFKGFSTGDLIARMNDSLRIKNTITMITGTVIINILVIIVSLTFVFYQSRLIGMLCLLSGLAFLLVGWKFHLPIIKKQKEVMAGHSRNETQYIDTLTGIQTLRSYGREEVFHQRIDHVYSDYQGKGYELEMLGNSFSLLTQIIVAVFTSLLFALGVYLVFEKSLSLGELMALIQVGSSILPALAGLVVANIQFQEAKVAFDRMYELAGIRSQEITNSKSPQERANVDCLLRMDGITFRYPGRSPILKNLSLSLYAGNTYALFAPVGTGKSTLVDVIQRFYEPEKGELSMPYLHKTNVSTEDWRKQLGIVSQKEKIFNSTVLDNIALSNSPEELQATFGRLQELGWAHLFDSFPQGILSICGEEGRNLSGGQRQLVSLARALVRHPRIIVLDEATTAMDFRMERNVIALIKKYITQINGSLLLITHQPSLARSMDQVMVLENGAISALGSFQELIDGENIFAEAYHHILEPNL